MNIDVSTKDLAEFFGVTVRTVANWHENGCPQVSRGKWNLKVVFDWWWDNIAQSRAVEESGDESMNEAKRLYWWQKAEGEKIKNEQLRENLVSWEDIDKEWAGRVAVVTSGLEAFADRLPPILDGKPRKEMREIIKGEVRLLRDAYAREGKYCPKTEEEATEKKKAVKGKKSGRGGKKL